MMSIGLQGAGPPLRELKKRVCQPSPGYGSRWNGADAELPNQPETGGPIKSKQL